MIDTVGVLLVAVACALLGVVVWDAAVAQTNAQHCREQLNGIPVKSARGVICLRDESVLKQYE